MQNSATCFSPMEFEYTNLKTGQIKSEKNLANYFVCKSHYFLTKQGWAHYGPARGLGGKGPTQQGQAKTTDLNPFAPGHPWGSPIVSSRILFQNNDSSQVAMRSLRPEQFSTPEVVLHTCRPTQTIAKYVPYRRSIKYFFCVWRRKQKGLCFILDHIIFGIIYYLNFISSSQNCS